MRKPRQTQLAVALSIAGSDSGGGAGVQADLKTFSAQGVHGTSVITCVTAQNPDAVFYVEPCTGKAVSEQMRAVLDGFRPAAVKTGMLYSREIIQAVAAGLRSRRVVLVVDPVMISTSGARLLRPAALRALVDDLFPLATLLTPNIPEAEALLNESVKSVEQMRTAAKTLHRRFGCSVLIKGGHLANAAVAVDVLVHRKEELLLRRPFIRGVRTHGTGCTYSAAITALLARGFLVPQAVKQAKRYVSKAIARSHKVAKYDVLNWQQDLSGA
jgi:hydroxymethylpyrimidine/phosphomethylpyrimidine kinase